MRLLVNPFFEVFLFHLFCDPSPLSLQLLYYSTFFQICQPFFQIFFSPIFFSALNTAFAVSLFIISYLFSFVKCFFQLLLQLTLYDTSFNCLSRSGASCASPEVLPLLLLLSSTASLLYHLYPSLSILAFYNFLCGFLLNFNRSEKMRRHFTCAASYTNLILNFSSQ